MSSRCRASRLAAAVLMVALGGCDREERHSRAKPFGETVPAGGSPDVVYAGEPPSGSIDPRAAAYEQNANAIAQGQQLFSTMNCVGCHAHGGGGMGPALMDDEWRYGGRIDQIASTIVEGRPNGMPSFRGKLTADQVWQVAAFVRTLSGQVRKDAVASRADEVSNTEPLTMTKREPVLPSDSARQ